VLASHLGLTNSESIIALSESVFGEPLDPVRRVRIEERFG
jgi:hypothetical protein